METSDKVGKIAEQKDVTQNKVLRFIFKNKLSVFLLLLAAFIFIWYQIKIITIEKNNEKVKTELLAKFEFQIDSLKIQNINLTAKVFSWAVRSELLRGNAEEVNLFFNEFVKEPGILKLRFVNTENSIVEIATDKKDEGEPMKNSQFLEVDNLTTFKDSTGYNIVTPIMGLNKKLGILIIDVKK